jgi:hypothetical protein
MLIAQVSDIHASTENDHLFRFDQLAFRKRIDLIENDLLPSDQHIMFRESNILLWH